MRHINFFVTSTFVFWSTQFCIIFQRCMSFTTLQQRTNSNNLSSSPSLFWSSSLLTSTSSSLSLSLSLRKKRQNGKNVVPTTKSTMQMQSTITMQMVVNDDEQKIQPKNVIVVGGGIGGLAVASRIAASTTTNTSSSSSSSAAVAAVPSCKVTIIEKNSHVGGRCGSFETIIENINIAKNSTIANSNSDNNNNNNDNSDKNNDTHSSGTFRHERGPSLLLLPDVYRDIFQDCSGKSAEEFGLKLNQCIPAYQVVFEDGDSIEVGFPRDSKTSSVSDTTRVTTAAELRSRQKMDSYEMNGAAKWDEYMRATSAFLDCGLPNFIEERFDLLSFPAFLIEALRESAQAWPLKPHSDVLDATFESEKMKALASFQDLYVGLEPYRNDNLLGGGVLKSTAPAVFGLLAAIELHPSNKKSGVFAPQGGFQSVTNALEKLATSLDVQFQCGKTVTSVQEDGIYVVATDGSSSSSPSSAEFIPADLIIVNADLPYATKSILNKDPKSNEKSINNPIFDWDDQFSFSSGVISFHWSVGKSLDNLNTHNVFMAASSRSAAEASWRVVRENSGDTQDPFNFYVHRASKTDPTAAPKGCDSIMVLVPCRTLLRDVECKNMPRDQAIKRYQEQFSDDVVSQARRAVLNRLAAIESLKDLEDYILDEVVDTPATWADKYNLAAGTPFALSHGFSQLSLFRPGAAASGIPNVLFCGASSRPGNGVPLVLIGAKQVAEKAIRALVKKNAEDEATEHRTQ